MISVIVADKMIEVRAPYACKNRCKALPGARWNPKTKCWFLSATRAAAAAVIEEFGIEERGDLGSDFVALLGDQIEACFADVPITKTTPWKHQRQAFWRVLNLLGDG